VSGRAKPNLSARTTVRNLRSSGGTVAKPTPRIFLLSPANLAGERARIILREGAQFELARRLRQGRATLGEVFAFISGLYFRGKLAYAQAFASPPPGLPSAFIITAGSGLLPPEAPITIAQLQQMSSIPIELAEHRYRQPLEQHCQALHQLAGNQCEFVLLGSIATPKYLAPITSVLGPRLLFPDEFMGRGDLSRGSVMLRCAREGVQLKYSPVSNLAGMTAP
jgi:hypothetical protein